MNRLTALLGACLLMAGTANAQGFYVGGTFGVGDASLSTNFQLGDIEDRLYFAKGFGGYHVNDYFAVEGSLVGASNNDFDDGFDGDTDANFAALTGSFLGIIPASDNFHLFARVGGYIGESDVGDSFLFFGSGNDQDESGLVFGGGFFINFGSREQFTIRVDYENYDTDVFDDLWSVSAGFQYNFGRPR